jgi:hypothetical protein
MNLSLRHWIRDSSVGIVTGYGLDGRARDFSVLHVVKTGSGDHVACYPMGIRDFYSGGKIAGA